jgi:hypothetical protein
MPPIGTSRGYGAEDENRPLAGEGANDSPDSGATGGHGSEHAGHGNAGHAGEASHGHGHDALDPDWVEPSDSTFDDILITSGGKPVDSAPVGRLPVTKVIDTLTPAPLPYRVNFFRAVISGIIATLVFTPVFYTLYFGYKDDSYDLGLLLGSTVGALFDPSLGWPTRLLGLAIHFGIGAGIAVTFAYMLFVFRTQSNGGRGVQFGILLNFAMMGFLFPVFVGVLPRWAPGMPTFENPDFLLNQSGPGSAGWGPLVVALLAHMLWGLVVGHLYRHTIVIRQSEAAGMVALAT